jgi:ketopantoate reductase
MAKDGDSLGGIGASPLAEKWRLGEAMKVCVVGAGAIGGLVASKLHVAGEEVSVIDRGSHLVAIRNRGLRLRWQDGSVCEAKVNAYESAADAGKHDLVVLGVKAYDLEHVARDIGHLLHRDTMVMTLQNGIPWWYFQRMGGQFDGTRLRSVDPNGILSDAVEADRIIGCVAYPAAAVIAPGVIRHVEGDRFPLGELDGVETERAKKVSDAFTRAGLRSRVLTDVRAELWLKAWGSVSFNPISALSHATMAGICRMPETRKLTIAIMAEAQSIAAKLGIAFRHTIEERLLGAEKVGEHKTSMLQDWEAENPLEVEALVGSVVEIGRLTNTPIPVIEAVYALIKLLDQTTQAASSLKRARRRAHIKAA